MEQNQNHLSLKWIKNDKTFHVISFITMALCLQLYNAVQYCNFLLLSVEYNLIRLKFLYIFIKYLFKMDDV